MRDDNFYDWDNDDDEEEQDRRAARQMLNRWAEEDRKTLLVERCYQIENSILELFIQNAIDDSIAKRTPLAQAAEIETLQLMARISRP